MNDFPRIEGHRSQEHLLRGFLDVVQRCRHELVDLDRSEIHALCLDTLSRASGGCLSILLQVTADGRHLRLELSSGPIACKPDILRLPLSSEDLYTLQGDLSALGSLASFQVMTQKAFGRQDLFCRTLSKSGHLSGALILVPPEGRVFTPDETDRLHLLASQSESLMESAEVFASLINQAMLDEVTGLFNHRYFRNRMPSEISRASRHGHPLSLLFCSVDDFPVYREKNGALAATSLLAEFAGFLKSRPQCIEEGFCFRASDISIRYGEDQFLVILPETPKVGARIKAERLVRALAVRPFPGSENQPLGAVTASVGVATFPEDAADTNSMLEAADQALSRAKQEGKNRVVVC